MQKDIGKHIVYADGRVWTKYWKRFMKFSINKQGYYYSIIEGKITLLHRLLAQTFIPNPNNLSDVDHINNNKLDNRLENLQWISHRNNSKKAWQDGLYPKGEKNSCVKLKEYEAKQIKYGHQDLTVRKIGQLYNVHHSQVISIRSGKSWKHI